MTGKTGGMRHRLVEQCHDDAAVGNSTPALILRRQGETGEDALRIVGAIEVHAQADGIGRATCEAVTIVEGYAAYRPTSNRSTRYAGKLASRILR